MLRLLSNPTDITIEKTYWIFSLFVLLSGGLAVATEMYYILLLPILLLGFYVTIADPKMIFLLFFAIAPFSIEIFMPNGLGTDLPTEPIALLLSGIAIVLCIYKFNEIEIRYLKHPITILMIIQLGWIFFTALFSQIPLISFKYLLAKSWYVIPFFFLPFYFLKNTKHIETVFKVLIASTSVAMIIIMIKHGMMGFTFKAINKAAHPIFRNHVIYAALLVLLVPFIWHFLKFSTHKKSWLALLTLFITAIYFTYTRAAIGCVFIAIGAYFIVHYRLAKYAAIASLIIGAVAVNSLVEKNKYLDFAPDYKKTVTHLKFDNLIEATYKLEDISTMERVYRWVAGLQMVKDRPLLGFGPGCFYPFYKDYTLSSFRTYVSDNPDKSGIHNYYFMSLVEQGVLGLIIVVVLFVFVILYGEHLYHRLTLKKEKSIIMSCVLGVVILAALLLMNDLIETDKLGSFFFLCLSVMVMIGVRKESTQLS